MHRRCKQSSDFPNKYSQMLVFVGKSLTIEDFSAMILVLQTNKKITDKEKRSISNALDLLAFLDRREYIKKNNLSFLKKLLEVIQRIDLVDKINYASGMNQSSCTGSTCDQPSYVLAVQPSSAQNTQEENLTDLKHEHAADVIMTIEGDEDVILPSSQDSITDDDKLALW